MRRIEARVQAVREIRTDARGVPLRHSVERRWLLHPSPQARRAAAQLHPEQRFLLGLSLFHHYRTDALIAATGMSERQVRETLLEVMTVLTSDHVPRTTATTTTL